MPLVISYYACLSQLKELLLNSYKYELPILSFVPANEYLFVFQLQRFHFI